MELAQMSIEALERESQRLMAKRRELQRQAMAVQQELDRRASGQWPARQQIGPQSVASAEALGAW